MKQFVYQVLCMFLPSLLFAQGNFQVVKGTVVDKQSQSPIIGATITLMNVDPALGARTNEQGKYSIDRVAPGRYEIKVSYVGYKDVQIPNVVVASGKETVQDIFMEENVRSLKSTTIRANNKNRTSWQPR